MQCQKAYYAHRKKEQRGIDCSSTAVIKNSEKNIQYSADSMLEANADLTEVKTSHS